MAIITLWNNSTGKTGQTFSALAIATYMAMEHNYRILLMSTGDLDVVSMHAFGLSNTSRVVTKDINGQLSVDMETGIEAISKLALSNRLNPQIISNYTKMIFKQRLEILAGPIGGDYKKTYSSCVDIIENARMSYDIVFVDLNHGIENETTKKILKMSDIILFNIEQKRSDLEEILKLKEEKVISSKNSLILANKYDRCSKYSTKNIARYIGERKEILSVPYNILFAEAVDDGMLAEFFLNPRIRRAEYTEDKTGFFVNELKKDSERIIYKIQELQMRI